MPNRKKTHEEFVEQYNNKYPNIEVISKYNGYNDDITLYCNICNYTWVKKAKWAYGCPDCEYKRRKRTNTHEYYLQQLKERNITKIIPIEDYKTSDSKILHKCCVCGCKWKVKPNNILSGYGCPACANNSCYKGINDMWTTTPELAKLLKNQEDGYKYTKCAEIKLDWICPDCGNLVKGKYPHNVYKQGIGCPYCSDGVSIPNKFIVNILGCLNIDFETEKIFNWSNSRRYDIYIDSLKCIVEMHGLQHSKVSFENIGGRSLKEEQENDELKEQLAINNGIKHYISIDASKSELDYIKNSILKSELSQIIDLSLVNWKLCYTESMSSLIIKTIKLWKSGIKTSDICHNLHISNNTACLYLHRGNNLGLCSYSGFNERFCKVICTTTGEIFNSIKSAGEYFNIKSTSHIGGCCRGERRYCGKHQITGERLKWQYYE